MRTSPAADVAKFSVSLLPLKMSGLVTNSPPLIGALTDPWLEVAATAAEALGTIGGPDDALPALVELQRFRYWVVRAAGLRGLLSLVERGRAGDLDELERQLRGFVLTATDFRPEFTIRSSYAGVVDAIARQRSSGA